MSINYGTVIALKGNDNGYCGWELEISKNQSIEREADKVSVHALTDVLCVFHDLQVMVVNSIMFIQCLGLILNSNELLIFLENIFILSFFSFSTFP